MESLSLAAVAQIVGGELRQAAGEEPAQGVETDSRRVRPGALFIALRGEVTDGHQFVREALANGAAAAVVTREWPDLPAEGPLIVVESTLAALHRLASWWRGQLQGKVVAVTGSSGKSVVKDALVHALQARYHAVGSIGSYNSQLGVPLSVLEVPREAEFAVMEAAISAPGEMELLAALLRPDFGILTDVLPATAPAFPTAEALVQEDLKLFAALPKEGWLLAPAGTAEQKSKVKSQKSKRTATAPSPPGPLSEERGEGETLAAPVYRFGAAEEGLPTVTERRASGGGTHVTFRFPSGENHVVHLRTTSRETVRALEAVVCAAHLLGVEGAEIADALEGYEPAHTRMEIWRTPAGVTLINDSYSADPISTRASLRALADLKRREGRAVFVVSGGARPDATRTPVGRIAAEQGVEVLVLVGGAEMEAEAAEFRARAPQGQVMRCARAAELVDVLAPHLRPSDTVLVQGPLGTGIDAVARELASAMAQNRLIVDVRALAANIAQFRRLVRSETKLLGMVKALAYGTALVGVARELRDLGLDWLGVSTADEGMALREAGIRLPILVMLCSREEVDKIVRHDLIPVIYSQDMIAPLAAAVPEGTTLSVHLKVDTGMRRTGVMPEEVGALVEQIRATGRLRLAGLMTHFASAEHPEEDAFTRGQIARFEEVRAEVGRLGPSDLLCHAAATAGAVRFPESHFDMVRIGLGLYGIYGSPAIAERVTLELAVSLVSRLASVRTYAAGDRIGYGGTFTVPHNGFRAGIVPMGYHDGLPIQLSNRGEMLVDGMRAPIVGRISMDSAVIDVTGIPSAQVGTEVLVYGRHGGYEQRPEAVAEEAGTIPYELLTRLGPRVQRVFIGR